MGEINKDTDIIDISEEIREKPQQKTEEQDTSVKQFRQRKKHGWIKWVVIGVVVAAVIAFVVLKAIETRNKIAEALNSNTTNTAEIKRMDISKAISSTGTIQSKDVRTITSPLSGVKIDEVNCKVGDIVTEGSIIVTFSREDINKKIGQLEEDITEAQQTKALDGGDRNYTYLNNNGLDYYNVASSYQGVERAGEDLQKAKDELQKACNEKADYKAKYEEAKEKIDGVKDELEEEQFQYKKWKEENPLPPGDTESEDYEKYVKRDLEYQSSIADLQTRVSEYESRIKAYDTGIDSYIKAEETAQNAVDTAQRNYDDAVVKSSKAQYDQVFSSAKNDYNYNKGNVTANDNVKSLERQKEERIDSLDNYIVTAPITGLVTEVNAQEGNGYQATTGALLTIQAVDVYEVTTQIDEYDINNVRVGQDVVIMTDATGEDEIDGKVTFIAPVAKPATGNSTSNTFEVKIDITERDERLRLGMSAKLNILVDTHKDVLAVPYDAIEEKENGDTVIYVAEKGKTEEEQDKGKKNILGIEVIGMDGRIKNADDKEDKKTGGFGSDKGNAREVPVKIGLESDYYTEIIGQNINEGMTVLVNSDAGDVKGDMDIFMGM